MKKISSKKNLRLILSFIRSGEVYSFVLEAILKGILANAPSVVISIPRIMVAYHDRDNICQMVFRLIGRYPVIFYDHFPSEAVLGENCLVSRHPLCGDKCVNFFIRLT